VQPILIGPIAQTQLRTNAFAARVLAFISHERGFKARPFVRLFKPAFSQPTGILRRPLQSRHSRHIMRLYNSASRAYNFLRS
jgi:hypothetical protein